MQVTLIVARQAINHGNGTFSLESGGIGVLSTPFDVKVVVWIRFTPADDGDHPLSVVVVDSKGRHVTESLYTVQIYKQQSGPIVEIVPFTGSLQPGAYQLQARLGKGEEPVCIQPLSVSAEPPQVRP